ncbi:Ig-like domain-containing protein [Glaciecola sp. SC05]|uniref:Ig-like domain-containing protein n=1 Tax=Glaciecola sp. SC05 TaxID=1987355 RepID=UPI003527A5CC
MKQVTRIFWLVTLTWLIAACGGGGSLQREDTPGAPITPDPTTPAGPVVTMTGSLTDSAGVAATLVAEGAPLTFSVTLENPDGTAVVGELVSFVFNQAGLATFSNDAGTALTNANGVAQINLFVSTLSGSGAVTASVFEGPSLSLGFESSGVQQQVPATLDLFASSTQLASSGSEQIELIAVVKSAQNILLAGIPISFSADQNASITVVNSVSGDDGTARALLTTSNNPENRTITISSSSGALNESIVINVVGTEVNINGASSIILNDSAPITLVLSDSDGNGIGGQAINLVADKGSLDNTAPVTNANGQISVNFTATESGVSTITATALNTSSSFSLNVQQDDFSFDALPSEGLALNQEQPLRLRWFRNNQPFVNGTVTVTTSRGSISVGGNAVNTAVTDAQGFANVDIRSAFAGPASISAVGADGSGAEVTARATLEFVATTVNSVFVDATPDIIGPEGQTATITAVVRDADGNLVKGKAVNFRLFADSTGGSISPNTAITDSNGIASTVYSSNAVSSIDGVTIEAESDGVTSITSLTVGDRAFDISIGTGNEIEAPDSATYRKEFAVFVTDAAGRPIANAALTATSTPPIGPAYTKGFWVWNQDARVYQAVIQAVCANEDTNGNGRLDAGEDFNNDGQLTPGNVVSINFRNGVARTDENGQASFDLRYARQFGPWVANVISLSGQSSGTESSEQQLYQLGVASDDLTEETSPPPANPFGSSTDCSNTL